MKQLREVSSMLDRAAAKNLIHKKTADRNKARFAKMVGKLAQD
jgi:ribosomal protein S20